MTRPAYRLVNCIPERCTVDEAVAAWDAPERTLARHKKDGWFFSTMFIPLPMIDALGQPRALFETVVLDEHGQIVSTDWSMTYLDAMATHRLRLADARRRPTMMPPLHTRAVAGYRMAA